MLRLPHWQQTIDVAMVHEENRIVGRCARQHRSGYPQVDPVVNRSQSMPAFQPIPETGIVTLPPRTRIVWCLPESARHLAGRGEIRHYRASLVDLERGAS